MNLFVTRQKLNNQGWSKQLLSLLLRSSDSYFDLLVGSPLFLTFWNESEKYMSPRERLEAFLNLLAMPNDLSGTLTENQLLVSKINLNLAPDDEFWFHFADIVAQAFPGDQLSQKGNLERRIHQFRYIISSHQAQYVRKHFKRKGMTDQNALAFYLSNKRESHWYRKGDYTLKESARLHNKLAIKNGTVTYPDETLSANLKVLVGFHTEFILDSQGNFLNETDAEIVTQSGIINGASFNYGQNDRTHWELDVYPAYVHDPLFRDQAAEGFRSPNLQRKKLFKKVDPQYDLSYFNARGKYSLDHKSSYRRVLKAIKKLRKEIKRL